MNENLSGNILSGLEGIVTVSGVSNQTCIITGDKKQKKYNLTYEPIEINSIQAYFLVHLTFEDGTVNTYFLPIQFLGIQSVVFEVPFQVATMQFYIYGNLKLKDTSLKSVITDALTEEQKEALNKVTTNSEYWDRILTITNNLGNVITEKLEGSINTAINTITNSSGQMYWEDGKFICRDGSTDEASTMAMMISPGGFMIADSKKSNGDWDWRTFGTGKGFTADEIIAGTLEAIAIRGVTITGSVITGGEVIGAIIKGGSLNINDRFIVDSDGDVQMSGAITWGADNSPVKVKYSTDNSNWHYDYQSGDTFAKYSYDGGLTWTSGIKIAGVDGVPGLPGENGGNGADGITYYSWIKYADDDKGNGISDYPVGKKYIGMAYNKTSHNETNEPTDYTWSKFVGEDGLDGTDGIPGKNGTDGKTYYTWIKYADTSTGEGMSNTSTGKKYIGIAYNKSTATESNVASDYTWSLIKGDKGDTGATGPQGPAGSDANIPDYIEETKITGTTIESCTIVGNIITGNNTIYSGDVAGGNYVEISPNNPVKVWRGGKVVSSLGYSNAGGGNLIIYDVGGQEAFKVECLADGNLRLYGNNTPGFIPDPNYPPELGIIMPNPNARYMEIKSGRVIFDEGSAGTVYTGDDNLVRFTRFLTESDMYRMLDNRYSRRGHTHTVSYSSNHTHYTYGDY